MLDTRTAHVRALRKRRLIIKWLSSVGFALCDTCECVSVYLQSPESHLNLARLLPMHFRYCELASQRESEALNELLCAEPPM